VAAFAPNPWVLIGARFMAGVGVGAEYSVADSYLSDILPASQRGRMAAWAYTCSFLAVPALGFLSLGLNERGFLGVAGWRILLVIGALGAVLVLLLRRSLPESPRWLASVGRVEEAHAAVRALASGTNPEAEDANVRLTAAPECTAADPAPVTNPLRRLRLSPYRERLVMLFMFHAFQPFGYYAFGTLAALVLISRGYDVTESLLFTAVSYFGYPIGSLLSIPLLKRFERRSLVMASVAAMAVFGLLFATVHSSALIVVFGFLTTAISNVFSNSYHAYQAEIFPSDVRTTRGGAGVLVVAVVQRGIAVHPRPGAGPLRRGTDVHGRRCRACYHDRRDQGDGAPHQRAQPRRHQPDLTRRLRLGVGREPLVEAGLPHLDGVLPLLRRDVDGPRRQHGRQLIERHHL
jgi:MFS transporter, putative metabolite:H+ symporter